MSDAEKFEAFKQEALQRNEEDYGDELRERYGTEAIEASNARFAGLSPERFAEMEELNARLGETLRAAVATGNPKSPQACELVALHKRWLCIFWQDYSAHKHRCVAQMYVDDPRFTQHYEQIAPGGAAFLRDAVWALVEG